MSENTALAPITQIKSLLTAQLTAMESALPPIPGQSAGQHALRAKRCARVALNLLRTTPALMKCAPDSIIESVLKATQLGLELDGVLGQAYLIPYGQVCQMQVGYRGFIALALRSGLVRSVAAAVVYPCDRFDYRRGSDPYLHHIPDLGATDPGRELCAYAIAYMLDGGSQWEVIGARRIAAAEAASKTNRGDSPWQKFRESMVRKSAIRELGKYLPQCPELIRAAIHDEYSEEGHAPPAEYIDVPDAPEPPPPPKGAEGVRAILAKRAQKAAPKAPPAPAPPPPATPQTRHPALLPDEAPIAGDPWDGEVDPETGEIVPGGDEPDWMKS